MGSPSAGDVVIIPFPNSDLSQSKRRPALILAAADRGDFLFCQITSKQYGDFHALPLKEYDFVSGGIKVNSFIRTSKLFTANEAIVLGFAGHLTESKLTGAIRHLIEMLSAYLDDDTL